MRSSSGNGELACLLSRFPLFRSAVFRVCLCSCKPWQLLIVIVTVAVAMERSQAMQRERLRDEPANQPTHTVLLLLLLIVVDPEQSKSHGTSLPCPPSPNPQPKTSDTPNTAHPRLIAALPTSSSACIHADLHRSRPLRQQHSHTALFLLCVSSPCPSRRGAERIGSDNHAHTRKNTDTLDAVARSRLE